MNDRLKKSIENLKEYVAEDIIYKIYREDKNAVLTNFDWFCINHCKDIENVLEALKEATNENRDTI